MTIKGGSDPKRGYLVVAGREYAPEHIARIDDVVRRFHAGETQRNALIGAGFSERYLELFRSDVYQERLRVWVCRLEAEYLDHRAVIFHESLALARNPETPSHVRERHYRTLGKWCGMESSAPALPSKAGQNDTAQGDSGGIGTNPPIDAEFEVVRNALESDQQGQ